MGLVACEPRGRSRTSPVVPSASVVVAMCAPPLSAQPVPSKSSAASPGASAYQLVSPQARNGCDSSRISAARGVDRPRRRGVGGRLRLGHRRRGCRAEVQGGDPQPDATQETFFSCAYLPWLRAGRGAVSLPCATAGSRAPRFRTGLPVGSFRTVIVSPARIWSRVSASRHLFLIRMIVRVAVIR